MTKFQRYYNKFLSLKSALENYSEVKNAEIEIVSFYSETRAYFHSKKIYRIGDLYELDYDGMKKVFYGKSNLLHKICDYLDDECAKRNIFVSKEEHASSEIYLVSLFDKLSSFDNKTLENKEIPFPIIGSTRIENAFNRMQIKTYFDLKKYGLAKTAKMRNIGKKSFKELSLFCIADLSKSVTDEKIEIKPTELNKFVELLTEIKDSNSIFLENGYNGKDFSLYQMKLRELIFNNANLLLTDREYSIFKRRNTLSGKETLEAIAVDYGVTRERIRQIGLKCEKKISSKMCSNKYCESLDFIKQFYSFLLMLGKEDIINYLSYSKRCDDLDWIILKKLVTSVFESASFIPKYILPKEVFKNPSVRLEERRKDLDEYIVQTKKETVVSFTEQEKSLINAMFSITKYRSIEINRLFSEITAGKQIKCDSLKGLSGDKYLSIVQTLKEKKAISSSIYMGNELLFLNFRIIDACDVLNKDTNTIVINIDGFDIDDNDLIILKAVLSLNYKYGVKIIVSILSGSNSNKIYLRNLDKHPFYGILKGILTNNKIEKEIRKLISYKLLERTNGSYPLLFITETGKDFLVKNDKKGI